MIQDSPLLHARSLIDFFTKRTDLGSDVLLEDFDLLAVPSTIATQLEGYKRPIEVHALHLTSWGDSDYRATAQPTGSRLEQQRVAT